MKKCLVVLLALSLTGCSFKSFRHGPTTAALAANEFLRAMYLEHNYERALNLSDEALRKSASADNLEHMVDLAERNCGQLRELKAESYRMTPGATMELFYLGRCDKGSLYHRLVIAGDSVNGYRVSGVWLQDSPYPEHDLRRRFETNIVVN